MYFDGNIEVNLRELDEKFKDLNFNDMEDIDALQIALYYFTDKVLIKRKK